MMRRTRKAVEAAAIEQLRDMYRWMYLSRQLEHACAAMNPRWFPVDGEEAAIVGTFHGLRSDDVVAPHYRGPFVVYAMRGAELDRLFAQALGKTTGYSRGRAVPFTGPVAVGTTPWVAGDLGTSLSVATGCALSFRYDRDAPGGVDDRVVVLTFGDGTSNRGDFHEALNLAAVWKLPIVFVCQNNHWSISLPLDSYLAAPSIADRASGYGIPGALVEGNDPIAVNQVVQAAVARARSGDGPSLIEARTYRLRGHWAEDAALYRSPDEVASWEARDPLPNTRRRLVDHGVAEREIARLEADIDAEVEHARTTAESAPDAGPADLGIGEALHSDTP